MKSLSIPLRRTNQISKKITLGLSLVITGLLAFAFTFQSTLDNVKEESHSTIGTFIPLSVTTKSLRSNTSDLFSVLNLEYYSDQKSDQFEIQSLTLGITRSTSKLEELSNNQALCKEALAQKQISRVIANAEDFMHSVESLNLSSTRPAELQFAHQFDQLYVKISESILSHDNLDEKQQQQQLANASYHLAYGHLLTAEIGGGINPETYNEILESFASSKLLLIRLEPYLDGGKDIVLGVHQLSQYIEKQYQTVANYQSKREQAYNDFSNSYAALHLNTLAVESYMDTLLTDHEANLVEYISQAGSMTRAFMISAPILGVGLLLIFYRVVLSPFNDLMKDTQLYLKSETSTATPGLNRKDEIGIIAQVVDDLKKSDSEKGRFMIELEEATEAAQKSNKAKSQFLANMSHEIRTPLNSIIGFTDIMHEEDLNKEQRNMTDSIMNSSKTLLALVNDILDLAKIESNELTIELYNTNLDDLLYEVAATLVSDTTQKSVELNIDTQGIFPQLTTDPTRLKQVIMNLVSNAAKFTEKGEILISLKSLDENDLTQTVKFSVTDTGIGMNKEQASSIFEAFKQADGSTTRKYGGTGLGLNISQKLVNALGGTISVESAPNKGSCFSFTLNLKKFYSSEDSNEDELDLTSLKKLNFLIVDDNASALKIMSRYFDDVDLKYHIADNVNDAIQILKDNSIQVVLTDIMMPGKDGYQLFEEASQLPQDLKFVAVTSDLRSSTISRIKQLGFVGYLFKPLRKKSLIKSLLELINSSQLKQSAAAKEQPNKHASASILLVDDNNTNVLVGSMILKRMGHQVTTASSGQEAIDRVNSTHFDLVLMDMQMPEMNGIEATQEIRNLGHTLPIIALTANAFESDRRDCLKAGMNDFMTKPVNKEALQKSITKYTSIETRKLS